MIRGTKYRKWKSDVFLIAILLTQKCLLPQGSRLVEFLTFMQAPSL